MTKSNRGARLDSLETKIPDPEVGSHSYLGSLSDAELGILLITSAHQEDMVFDTWESALWRSLNSHDRAIYKKGSK